jgi:hypothetical protein
MMMVVTMVNQRELGAYGRVRGHKIQRLIALCETSHQGQGDDEHGGHAEEHDGCLERVRIHHRQKASEENVHRRQDGEAEQGRVFVDPQGLLYEYRSSDEDRRCVKRHHHHDQERGRILQERRIEPLPHQVRECQGVQLLA